VTLDWAALDRCAGHLTLDGLTDLLLAATEDERRGFAKELETRIKAVPSERYWRQNSPAAGYALAAIGCLPTAARTAALLGRREIRNGLGSLPTSRFLELARARELPWIGDLAVRLAGSIPARVDWHGEWSFASALLGAAGVEPPVTEGVVRSWLKHLHHTSGDERPVPLAQRLRDSPYLDLLLPAVFDIDGLGGELTSGWLDGPGRWDTTPRWPAAVAKLVAEGRLDRRTVFEATVDRLVRGDRPAWLRPFALLHDALAPTGDELAGHTADYARLLVDAPSTVAGMAQRALRRVDDAGRLEFETLMEASAATLVRPEKGLVKAQLSWLEKVARRAPDRAGEVLVTVAVAFDHPALEIQDRALSLISRRIRDVDAATAAHLTEAAGCLDGDLPSRAEVVFGTVVQPAVPSRRAGPPPLPRPPAPAVMPPAISGAAELAEEVVALLHEETAVRWERVLGAIVTLRTTADTTDLAAALGPVLDRYRGHFTGHGWTPRSRIVTLGDVLHILAAPSADRGRRARQRPDALLRAVIPGLGGVSGSQPVNSPPDVLTLRLTEISDRLSTAPVPTLLCTPTLVTGSLDADVLLGRLRSAEEEGWQPWPTDLEQALLRVPREVDGHLLTRAGALRSPAGREFARWLVGGGMPDPVGTRCEQHVEPDDRGHAVSRPGTHRVLVGLEPARAGTPRLHASLATLRPPATLPYLTYGVTAVNDQFAMVLPHHRDVVAAWALPYLASLADSDWGGGASLLPLLAESSGPLGPAMSLSLAYVLGARHETDRVAGVDAFLALAAGDEPFGATLGADLGNLCAGGTVKLSRVVPALAETHRAGAAVAVWELAAAALPLLLPAAPRGLADLLELASRAASAVGAKDDIPELAAVAGRTSSSRLVTEARRLQAVLRG